MKTFVLVGEQAVKDFQNENWSDFQSCILMDYQGDLIAWNKETDSVSTLLDMLQGWDSFVELSKHDLIDIENNTKIEIDWY